MIRILMLGWEYPPNITGGLGTACEGLTKALAQKGFDIQFVIPKVFGDESATHMRLSEPEYPFHLNSGRWLEQKNQKLESHTIHNLKEVAIPAFLTPYLSSYQYDKKWEALTVEELKIYENYLMEFLKSVGIHEPPRAQGAHYGQNLFSEVENFARRVLAWASTGIPFDVIHAHDWMTYSAGILLKEMTGCPLIVHVHSIEHDRSGEHGNPRIMGLESLGMQKADRVIAVSHLTKNRIVEKYQINDTKIAVVHNGMPPKTPSVVAEQSKSEESKKYVLFLGRVTFQKGPDYFVKAAQKVIPEIPNVVFILGGAGDMLPAIRHQVEVMGLQKYFEFPGFLKGEQVEKAYAKADLYVMPSVSEPFGIAPLEAINCNTPVLISRQSGVSEVLSHALKANFWDVDELANLIVGALKYPELRADLVKMAKQEMRQITWDVAADKTAENYLAVLK